MKNQDKIEKPILYLLYAGCGILIAVIIYAFLNWIK